MSFLLPNLSLSVSVTEQQLQQCVLPQMALASDGGGFLHLSFPPQKLFVIEGSLQIPCPRLGRWQMNTTVISREKWGCAEAPWSPPQPHPFLFTTRPQGDILFMTLSVQTSCLFGLCLALSPWKMKILLMIFPASTITLHLPASGNTHIVNQRH